MEDAHNLQGHQRPAGDAFGMRGAPDEYLMNVETEVVRCSRAEDLSVVLPTDRADGRRLITREIFAATFIVLAAG